jgi:Zn-dependent peptidase ImmA (M78 family)
MYSSAYAMVSFTVSMPVRPARSGAVALMTTASPTSTVEAGVNCHRPSTRAAAPSTPEELWARYRAAKGYTPKQEATATQDYAWGRTRTTRRGALIFRWLARRKKRLLAPLCTAFSRFYRNLLLVSFKPLKPAIERESGTRPPTLRQVQELSRFYHRPLSVFFLAAPPQVPPPAAEYRRLPGVVPGQESPELRLAVRRMSSRRENALNLMEELGEPVTPFSLSARLDEAPEVVGARLRVALGIDVPIQLDWPNEWRALNAWRAAVESLGVLVFQFSKVALAEARGISLLHFPLPVVGVNSKEQPEPKSYTLIHELVHVMLAAGHEELPALKGRRDTAEWEVVERFAESAASHTLVPEDALAAVVRAERLPQSNWDIGDVRKLARRFKISPLAMATRLRASGYFAWSHYQSWRRGWDAWVASLPLRSGGFANPVGQALARNGRPYIQLVLEALGSNRITTVDAARYLDLKAEHFEKLRGALSARPGTSEDSNE